RPRRKTDSGITGGTRPEAEDAHPCFGLSRRWERAQNDERTARRGTGSGPTVETRWNLGVIGVTAVVAGLATVGLSRLFGAGTGRPRGERDPTGPAVFGPLRRSQTHFVNPIAVQSGVSS